MKKTSLLTPRQRRHFHLRYVPKLLPSQTNISIYGENTQPPVFNQPDGYSGEVSKGFGLGFALDSVPGDPFLIIATDSDYVCPANITSCFNKGSNNEVECSAKNSDGVDDDEYFTCSTEKDTEGSYAIILTLIKSLQDVSGDSYSFNVVASVSE